MVADGTDPPLAIDEFNNKVAPVEFLLEMRTFPESLTKDKTPFCDAFAKVAFATVDPWKASNLILSGALWNSTFIKLLDDVNPPTYPGIDVVSA